MLHNEYVIHLNFIKIDLLHFSNFLNLCVRDKQVKHYICHFIRLSVQGFIKIDRLHFSIFLNVHVRDNR